MGTRVIVVSESDAKHQSHLPEDRWADYFTIADISFSRFARARTSATFLAFVERLQGRHANDTKSLTTTLLPPSLYLTLVLLVRERGVTLSLAMRDRPTAISVANMTRQRCVGSARLQLQVSGV